MYDNQYKEVTFSVNNEAIRSFMKDQIHKRIKIVAVEEVADSGKPSFLLITKQHGKYSHSGS